MAGQRKNSVLRFTIKMQKKLVVLYLFILAAFLGLSARLFLINRDNGEEYKKQVLSHQEYDSVTIPFKRGEIIDANGTVLAVSNKGLQCHFGHQALTSEGGLSGAHLERAEPLL